MKSVHHPTRERENQMRAVICNLYGPPELLTVGDFPEPSPGPGQVLIAVEAAGVSFVDTLTIRNRHQFKHPVPFVPGMEVAGTVAALGAGVKGLDVGRRVMALVFDGGYAPRAVADASETFLLPDAVDSTTAAALASVYLTAYCALRFEARIQPGERLLVSGAAGGVGLACVSIGAAFGAEVTACASTEDKCALAREFGARTSVCYGAGDLAQALKTLGGDHGFDVAADPVAGDVYEPLFRSLGWGGRYVSLGFAGGAVPQIPANLLLVKNRAALGMVLMYYRKQRNDLLHRAATELLDLVARQQVRVHVDRLLPLERAAEAIAAIEARTVRGKIVVSMAAAAGASG
jgi:NADPH:quinone reductase